MYGFAPVSQIDIQAAEGVYKMYYTPCRRSFYMLELLEGFFAYIWIGFNIRL